MHDAPSSLQARIQRVLDHMDQSLDDDLSGAALSRVAGLSRHHFHRQFSAVMGIGVHRYVQRLRLRRAARQLAYRDRLSITEIALDAGYEAPEAFGRAFRALTGQTPSAFRAGPSPAAWQALAVPGVSPRPASALAEAVAVTIVERPRVPVAVLDHQGDPAGLPDSLRRFIAWRRAQRLPPTVSETFNVFHVHPDDCPPDDFRLGLCAATNGRRPALAEGMRLDVLPGGRCAVVRVVGPDAALTAAADLVYGRWLPEAGEQPRDVPPFCRRITLFPDVPEHAAENEFIVPLAEPASENLTADSAC